VRPAAGNAVVRAPLPAPRDAVAARQRARSAAIGGVLVAFVVAVALARFLRPELLFDPEPSWAIPRLALGLAVLAAATIAGGLTAAALSRWSGARALAGDLPALPLSRLALVPIGGAALAAGALARFLWLDRLPPVLWVDELVPIAPALGLRGAWSDFHDAIRVLAIDRPIHAMSGVAYLELYRVSLKVFGVTVEGIRFPSAAAGVLSLITGACLGRALLPRGGATLTLLVLAGLRWHVIFSRWGWNAMALVPIADLAALILLRARRRGSVPTAVAAGAVGGIGAHVYLGAWIVAAALALFALWPREDRMPPRRRLALAGAFLGGFLALCVPILALRSGRAGPYFSRAADANWLRDVRVWRSGLPALSVLADSLAAPWFVPDPVARHDIPGRSRLGWIFGIPFAAILGRCLLRPRDELSALLLAQASAATAASFQWGMAGHPNGYRFLHLTTLAAVGVAAGTLLLVGLCPPAVRRACALAAVGTLAIGAAWGIRDAFRWAGSPQTFDAFRGPHTLIGRAAVRWAPYGRVEVGSDLEGNTARFTIDTVTRHRLDPEARDAAGGPLARDDAGRLVRLARSAEGRAPNERIVEHVVDPWGREWAVVLGRRSTASADPGSGLPYHSSKP